MRARQPILATIVAVDIEPAEAIHAFKFLESVERNFAGASDELKELGSLFLVERADRAPEPDDLR